MQQGRGELVANSDFVPILYRFCTDFVPTVYRQICEFCSLFLILDYLIFIIIQPFSPPNYVAEPQTHAIASSDLILDRQRPEQPALGLKKSRDAYNP